MVLVNGDHDLIIYRPREKRKLASPALSQTRLKSIHRRTWKLVIVCATPRKPTVTGNTFEVSGLQKWQATYTTTHPEFCSIHRIDTPQAQKVALDGFWASNLTAWSWVLAIVTYMERLAGTEQRLRTEKLSSEPEMCLASVQLSAQLMLRQHNGYAVIGELPLRPLRTSKMFITEDGQQLSHVATELWGTEFSHRGCREGKASSHGKKGDSNFLFVGFNSRELPVLLDTNTRQTDPKSSRRKRDRCKGVL